MTEVKDAVFNHLGMDTNGALLISGEWGAGKTYYIKRTLFKEIKDKTKYKPVMVSLYGENETKNISTKIIQGLVSNNFVPISKITGYLSKITKAIPYLKRIVDAEEAINLIGGGIFELIKKNNIVLFFDDLERLGKKLSKNDFLGYVNDLTENQNCKVVIVANYGEIEEGLSYKEKTISKTVVFSMGIDQAFKNVRESYKNDKEYYEFLNENEDFFLKTLDPSTEKISNKFSDEDQEKEITNALKKKFVNIRSLKSALEDYKVIFNLICKNKDLSKEFIKTQFFSLWAFCLSVTMEARQFKGLEANNKKDIDRVDRYIGLFFFNDEKEKKYSELEYYMQFKILYFDRIEMEYYYYPSLFNFITSGKSIDAERLQKQINEYFRIEDDKLSPEYKVYQNFMSFKRTQMTDDEFKENLKLLLDYTEKGLYLEYAEYTDIAKFLIRFKDYFDTPKTIEEISEKIKIGIKKMADIMGFRYQWEISKEHIEDELNNDKVKDIISFTDRIVAEKKNDLILSDVKILEEMLLNSPRNFVIKFIEEKFPSVISKHDPLFCYFDTDKIIDRILKWQTEDLTMFAYVLEKRYLKSYVDPLKADFPNLLKVTDFIMNLDTSEKKYSNYSIEKTLVPTAKSINKRIKEYQK